MTRQRFIPTVLIFVVGLASCQREAAEQPMDSPPELSHGGNLPGRQPVEVHDSPMGVAHGTPSSASQEPLSGSVAETMDAGRYTYIRLQTEQGLVWAAATKMQISVGDRVELSGFQMMQNFRSPTLDRTFDEILFVSNARVLNADSRPPSPGEQGSDLPPNHPPIGQPTLPPGHPSTEAAHGE